MVILLLEEGEERKIEKMANNGRAGGKGRNIITLAILLCDRAMYFQQ
jgi:hypothetical protein